MKKILVAGGAGFLGFHLCKRLLDKKHHVVCVDNFFSGSKDNIQSLLKDKHFEFIFHDVVDPFVIEVDDIYNLACAASPKIYQKDPRKTMKTSFLGSLNLLELASKNSASYFFASSSEVYGDAEINPQPESYWGKVNPIGRRACYDEGKRIGECLAVEFKKDINVNIKIGRIFNTYGPKMHIDDGRVVSNFIWQALTNKPITVYGDGSQTRSFCFVDDTVLGIEKLMNSESGFSGPVNLGNDNEISVKTLAELVINMDDWVKIRNKVL